MRGFISKIRHGFRTGEFFPFEAFDQRLPYFHHHHNCGFPGKRRTERTVELAIADWWLKQHPDAVEVGAVTPYYWPGRVANVIPVDLAVPGCPPAPLEILRGILTVVRRTHGAAGAGQPTPPPA